MIKDDFKLVRISSCEVCGHDHLEEVLNLGLHPLCDDLKKIHSNETCEFYPVEILFCTKCKTAHQKYQVPKETLFQKDYHYRARFTQDVLNGMQDIVKYCSSKYGDLAGKIVLDIGCNDGSLLNFFREEGAHCIGIDPTSALQDINFDGHYYNDYFDHFVANKLLKNHGVPNFITFTNVFAHIENLNGLIESLKVLMGPKTILIIENHYLGDVLSRNQFDTFYHEHPRTYSASSFKFISDKLGVTVNDVTFPKRYGGNIRVVMSKGGTPSENFPSILDKEKNFKDSFADMVEYIQQWKIKKKLEIQNAKDRYGEIYAKAFPGRASILIKLLGIDVDVISGVFERDSSIKVGHYLPGTKIPILQDKDMPGKKPQCLINLAWHIKDEIKNYLIQKGYQGEIIDIL